jgi:hypothetical protein
MPPIPEIAIPPDRNVFGEDTFEYGFRRLTSPPGMLGIDQFEIEWKDPSFLSMNPDVLGIEDL